MTLELDLEDYRDHLKESDKPSQNQLILEHIKEGKTLTKLEALVLYGCMQLGTRINELRNIYGHNAIKTEMVKRGNKTFAQYSWEGTKWLPH